MARNAYYHDRRVSRSELANRISHASEFNHLRTFAKKWFFDKDIGVNLHGNTHLMSGAGIDHYHERLVQATRGDYQPLII